MVSPFKTGNGVALQTAVSTADTAYYLDSSTSAGKIVSVYLSDSRDFETHPGCYWDLNVLSNNRIRLIAAQTGILRYALDSSAGAERDFMVYLGEAPTAGAGSHWLPTRLDDDTYSVKCDSPSGLKQFLCADPSSSKKDSVYLVQTSTSPDTHWNILLTHYTRESMQSIICAVYPSVPISSCETNGKYGSLEYDRLHGIWKDTQLGDNQITPDLAVYLKAEVYKHSSNSNSPWPNDKGSLCGIIWGSIGGKTRALNFTIDPFQNLILFDPQNGQKIVHNEFTPTFCMV